jgi:hypothetical protein
VRGNGAAFNEACESRSCDLVSSAKYFCRLGNQKRQDVSGSIDDHGLEFIGVFLSRLRY